MVSVDNQTTVDTVGIYEIYYMKYIFIFYKTKAPVSACIDLCYLYKAFYWVHYFIEHSEWFIFPCSWNESQIYVLCAYSQSREREFLPDYLNDCIQILRFIHKMAWAFNTWTSFPGFWSLVDQPIMIPNLLYFLVFQNH